MLEFFDSLWIFFSAVIAMIILGLVAGFSPTLYVTQIGIASTAKRARWLMISLMAGVLLGIIFLSIFFQFFQLDNLRTFIDNDPYALLISIIFHTLVGIAFIVGGLWYVNKKPNRLKEDKKTVSKSKYAALVSLGFFRTFASVSGAAATFFASGIISSANTDIATRTILTVIFLVATITPFVLIIGALKRYPQKIERVLSWLKKILHQFNYKLIIGTGAILIGSGIIIFNALRLITF